MFIGVFKDTSTNMGQLRGLQSLCNVITYNYREVASKIGVPARNKDIIDVVTLEKPDVMIIAKGNSIDTATIEECKKHTHVALWFMDAFIPGHWTSELQDKIGICHSIFCDKLKAVEEATKINPNTYWVCEGFDSDIEFPHDIPKEHDVSFIGNVYGSRSNILQRLGISALNSFDIHHAIDVSASHINLNICTGNCASDRVYKIMAAGGFLLTDDWYGRDKMFRDKEHLVIWKDLHDLQNKIEYYLEHDDEREKIAMKGFLEVKQYSRKNWARKVLNTISKTPILN
tara:strand:+ start:134 stop:991 length:858 start_codon:yes stop_codon:yes gene_type:complete